MKSTLVLLALGAAGLCWGQAPPDCKPNPLNVPEAKYPCIFPDNRVMYRVIAPNAQAVRVGNTNLTKGPDNIWSGTTAQPAVEGFHYYGVNIDGATVADPSTRTYFGSGWWNSGIEIPAPDQEFYQPKEVPRGRVSEQWYYSKVTGKWRRCFVYTPPGYDGGKNKYPVFYLLHGWGEDETAWFNQGRVDFIMDNLIAEKKAKPMIIVMDNLNAVKPGESAMRFAGRGLVPDPSDHPAPPPAARGGAPGAGRVRSPGAAPGARGALEARARRRGSGGQRRRCWRRTRNAGQLGFHRDDAHRLDPHDRKDLPRASRRGEPRDGRAIDGRLPDPCNHHGQPRQVRLHRPVQRRQYSSARKSRIRRPSRSRSRLCSSAMGKPKAGPPRANPLRKN